MSGVKAVICKYRKPLSFAAVGVINTFVDFSVFSLTLFAVSGLGVVFAQGLGYCAGLVCSFFLNKYIRVC